ncbi:hypothetical protein HDU99_008505, partial [Rhizoclosmatium hyalinum]
SLAGAPEIGSTMASVQSAMDAFLKTEQSSGAGFTRAQQKTINDYCSLVRSSERQLVIQGDPQDVTIAPWSIQAIMSVFFYKFIHPFDPNEDMVRDLVRSFRSAAGLNPLDVDVEGCREMKLIWNNQWPTHFGYPRGNNIININRLLLSLKLLHALCCHSGPYVEEVDANGRLITSGDPFNSQRFK